MNNLKKLMMFVFIVAALLVGVGVYIKWNSDVVVKDVELDSLSLVINNVSVSDNATLTFDNMREYINKNSVNIIDDDFRSYYSDHERVARMMLDYDSGRSTYSPHLECSSRSQIFMTLLKLIGYKSRVVSVWTHLDEFPSHTFIEIFNDSTETWQAYDADYNLYYENINSKQRLSVNGLLRLDQSEYHPCGKETGCGWDIRTSGNDRASNLKKYMALASYSNENGPLTVVNIKRFPLEKLVQWQGRSKTFCDAYPSICSASRIEYR